MGARFVPERRVGPAQCSPSQEPQKAWWDYAALVPPYTNRALVSRTSIAGIRGNGGAGACGSRTLRCAGGLKCLQIDHPPIIMGPSGRTMPGHRWPRNCAEDNSWRPGERKHVDLVILGVALVVDGPRGGGRDSGGSLDPHHRPDRGRAGHQAVLAQKTSRRQPDRLPRRGRLPGRSVDAGLAFQAVGGVRRGEAPLGAGPGRGDRRRRGPGGPAPAGRRQVGRVGERVEPDHRPPRVAEGRRTKGRAAPRAAARQPHAGPSGRLSGDYPRARVRRARGPRVPALAGPRQAHLPGVRIGRRATQGHGDYAAHGGGRRSARYLRHRHGAGRPAVAGRRHRQPPRRVRRHQAAGRRRTPPIRCSSRP